LLPIGATNEVLAHWWGALSYLHDPSSIPGYASLFLSELDHEIYCINKVILINVKAAAVAQLVKACDSFAQHQGSIPTSLKFFFSNWMQRRGATRLAQKVVRVLLDAV